MKAAALFFCVSLTLPLVASQAPQGFQDVVSAKSEAEFERSLDNLPNAFLADEFFSEAVENAKADPNWKSGREKLIQAGRLIEVAAPTTPKGNRVVNAKVASQRILKDAAYRDPGVKDDRNWMSKTGDNLRRSAEEFLKRIQSKSSDPSGSLPTAGLNFLTPLIFVLLGAGLVTFLVYFLWKFKFSKNRVSKSGALLSDDEPDLSADEWLEKSRELERDGQFREAVRCLYLASLIRLEEGQFLRFVRSETNWEHLRRFEKSPAKPASVDLRTVTLEFDRVWYGHRDRGAEDVAEMRNFYLAVLETLGRGPK